GCKPVGLPEGIGFVLHRECELCVADVPFALSPTHIASNTRLLKPCWQGNKTHSPSNINPLGDVECRASPLRIDRRNSSPASHFAFTPRGSTVSGRQRK